MWHTQRTCLTESVLPTSFTLGRWVGWRVIFNIPRESIYAFRALDTTVSSCRVAWAGLLNRGLRARPIRKAYSHIVHFMGSFAI